jgi:hypothetical protein
MVVTIAAYPPCLDYSYRSVSGVRASAEIPALPYEEARQVSAAPVLGSCYDCILQHIGRLGRHALLPAAAESVPGISG